MIITQKGVVDITPEYNRALRPVFCVSEGDKTSRQIVLTVMRGGEAFLIPSGATVYIIGKKSDSNIFTYRCNYSGSDVTFDITKQMSAASGIVLCELQINLSGEVLGSANFVYWTEPAPIENGTYSESDLNIMLEAIAGAERLDNFYAGIEDMVADAVEQIQIMPGQVVIDPTLLVNGAAADAAATGNAVRSFLNALVTESTAEATIATCDDAAGGLPLKKLVANIVPSQSGTGDPSPDNVRPISGYTGVTVSRTAKNLLPKADASTIESSGITWTINEDGTISAVGTATGNTTRYYPPNSALLTVPKVPLIVSGCPAGGAAATYRIIIYKYLNGAQVEAVNSYGESVTIDPTGGSFDQIRVGMQVRNGATVNIVYKPMLRLATETDDTYEPYNGATYAVNFPTEAGTVYGGTLTVNSDGSGTLTVTQNTMVTFDGSENWTVSAGTHPSYRAPRGMLPANAKGMVSNMLIMDDAQTAVNGHGYVGTTNIVCYIDDASADNLAEWKAKLAETPLQVVYPLDTPTTYALSAVEVAQMLSGVNNVWTDAAGTLNVEYYANTALYVEKIVNAQKRMITGVEESMTATKNYAIGDLLIVGTTLYRTTAAIASGAAITVGTNVTETTVAEQLLALA